MPSLSHHPGDTVIGAWRNASKNWSFGNWETRLRGKVYQLNDAASSVTRNIAEGFGRYRHKEFAQFLSIARGSLFEIIDHLHDGIARRHWTEDTIKEHRSLCNRTIAAITHFIQYLRSSDDSEP